MARAVGDNDPKAWCGRDGAWDLPDVSRIDDGVIPCGDSTELRTTSCATRASTSPCRFEYIVVVDECLDPDCDHTLIQIRRCKFNVPTETIVSGDCQLETRLTGLEPTVDEGAIDGTWTGP